MMEAVGAERAILSIFFKEPQSFFEVDDILDAKDFTNSGTKVIFSLIADMLRKDNVATIDTYTIMSHAEKTGVKDFMSLTHNGQLIEAIESTNVKVDSLGKHVDTVKSMTMKRQLTSTLDSLKETVENFCGEANDLKSIVEDTVYKKISSIDNGGEEIQSIDSEIEETINKYADVNTMLGLDVGLPRWQRDCGGIRNGTVTGVFARAKTGKSQFSAWCSVQAAIKQGLPTLYLDTELQLRDQQVRTTSILSEISFDRVESGAWKSDPAEVAKIKAAFGEIKGSPFFYKNISGRSVSHVIPLIRKFVHKYVGESKGDDIKCLIVYDYIKLMNQDDIKNGQEWQILGFLLSSLHDVAAQLNIPILALGQLNREALKMDNEYTVGGSDRIVHNLDSLTIFRAKREEEIAADGEHRGTHIFKVPVARKGPGHQDGDHINIKFDKSKGVFKEDKRRSEIIEAIKAERPIRDRLADMDDEEPLGNLRED